MLSSGNQDAGGKAVAILFAEALHSAGLPVGLLQVTGEGVADAEQALRTGVDKVFFTGSAASGRRLLRGLAETLTPSVMELSGCDAVVVLPSADLDRTLRALAFGMRLNGSATCMAPRRVILVDADAARSRDFCRRLAEVLSGVPGIPLGSETREQLSALLTQATREGATVIGDVDAAAIQPILVTRGHSLMDLASADIFAPVLLVMETSGEDLEATLAGSPLALTVSIFGEEREARRVQDGIVAGSVLINDLIVPTADPRLPFGGRRQSGFGVTRGREGLLEMTAIKVVTTRRGGGMKHYDETDSGHFDFFGGILSLAYDTAWRERWCGLKRAMKSARHLKRD